MFLVLGIADPIAANDVQKEEVRIVALSSLIQAK
jgi:hypothetical protein